MIIVHAPDHELHRPPHEFFDGALIPVFESPERVAIILAALEQAGHGPVVAPRSFGPEPVPGGRGRLRLKPRPAPVPRSSA
jgi:hypothetical protein